MRWILLNEEGTELGRFSSHQKISEYVGCTRAHIQKYLNNNEFSHKKKKFKIIDRLA